mgnify:CR=1 FL=1
METSSQKISCKKIFHLIIYHIQGVIELSRMVGHDPFAEEDEEIVNSYLVWGGISLYYAEVDP